MEDHAKLIVSLAQKAADYGKTSLELLKLKTFDKTSAIVSSLIPHTIVFIVAASFMIFLNLGLAFWLGEILNKPLLGFFIVAAFYLIIALIMHFFLHGRFKTAIRDFIVKQALK